MASALNALWSVANMLVVVFVVAVPSISCKLVWTKVDAVIEFAGCDDANADANTDFDSNADAVVSFESSAFLFFAELLERLSETPVKLNDVGLERVCCTDNSSALLHCKFVGLHWHS